MNQHELGWSAAKQEWFCVRCLRTSDHSCKEDAGRELSYFECVTTKGAMVPAQRTLARSSLLQFPYRECTVSNFEGSLGYDAGHCDSPSHRNPCPTVAEALSEIKMQRIDLLLCDLNLEREHEALRSCAQLET